MSRNPVFAVLIAVSLFLVAASARAETLQAPIGGKAIALGDARVVCGLSGEWAVEQDGHAVRPPSAEDAVGKTTEVKVAANSGQCSTPQAQIVALVATGRLPAIDPTASILFVDDARVEVHGRGLRGIVVRWRVGDRAGEDRCVQPLTDGAGEEKCNLSVGRGLPADPTVDDLEWWPAGARVRPDVVTFDGNGRRINRGETSIRPARVVVSSLVPPDVSIDLAGGTASRIPLVHPDAVVGADCGATSCDVSGAAILVSGLATVSGALNVRLRLAPRVFLGKGDTFDPAPILQVPVLPCAMAMASGDALRGVDASRVVVRVDARCAGEARNLRWFSAGRALDAIEAVDAGGATYVELRVGRVEGDELVVTASRGDADGSIVGQARAPTRPLPPPHAALAILGTGQTIDFVPTNRPATVRYAKVQGAGELVLLPVDGVYDVGQRDGTVTIQGEGGAGGFVQLRFAWRVPSLPGALGTADLAIVTDPVARPMEEANVAVPLGASALGTNPIVQLVCDSGKELRIVAPGSVAHIPFEDRDACRLIFHRALLTAADGPQNLQIEVDVTRVDGQSRPEAHVLQQVVLRAGDKPYYAWIKGVAGQFDRVTVRVSHSGEVSSQDDTHPPPSVQWAVVFGTGHFRLYATTAIPTGLYRVSDRSHSGILSLNFGVLLRGTWLDPSGHEGFVGAEAGVMAVGLANDASTTGQSLTQVSTVAGLGISVPIANRSLATEANINLHAWFEFEPSRAWSLNETGNPVGFVFGPSISIGNIGMNL